MDIWPSTLKIFFIDKRKSQSAGVSYLRTGKCNQCMSAEDSNH